MNFFWGPQNNIPIHPPIYINTAIIFCYFSKIPAIHIEGNRGSVSRLQSTGVLCKTEIIKLWNNSLHFTIFTSILEISLKKTKQTTSNYCIMFFCPWESNQTEISPINLSCKLTCEFLSVKDVHMCFLVRGHCLWPLV